MARLLEPQLRRSRPSFSSLKPLNCRDDSFFELATLDRIFQNGAAMRKMGNWADLELLKGVSNEGADLDFKDTIEASLAKAPIEAAKDVAALANALGGHIIVGTEADMGGSRCIGLRGIDAEAATRIRQLFEEAVKTRCSPTPLVSVEPIQMPTSEKVVLVVTVIASAFAPVGVSLDKLSKILKKEHEQEGQAQSETPRLAEHAWVFPVRIGSLTEFLHPDQFGVFESMTARRAAAQLNAIPENERHACVLRWTAKDFPHSRDMTLERIEVSHNVAVFHDRDHHTNKVAVPLDEIVTVWQAKPVPVRWHIGVRGAVRPESGTGLLLEYIVSGR